MMYGWRVLIYHLVMVDGKLLIQHLKKEAWVRIFFVVNENIKMKLNSEIQ